MIFGKMKELQSLLKARTRSLKNAERKIEDRNILIADMEKQANVLYGEKKELESENQEQKELIVRIEKLVNSNKYNNEKAILEKIKELVHDYQSKN